MYRSKSIKKKTRTRQILLQNLRKGKARKESRCGFEVIPHPLKFKPIKNIHFLYADVVLKEDDGTLVTEASLYNHFKIYKTAQIYNLGGQKVLKIKVENKFNQKIDWKAVVQKLKDSGSDELKGWEGLITTYCERYENVIKEFHEEPHTMSKERLESLQKMNEKTEKLREGIIKTYPFLEFKSQLKNGHIEMTEISVNEKYLAEIGFTIEEFASTVLREGFPEMTPSSGKAARSVATLRLQKYLTIDYDGFQTPDFETHLVLKNGCMKKIKMRLHYNTTYEKGVPGFVFIAAILAKQKPFIPDPKPIVECQLNKEFLETMSYKEKETNDFLKAYYNHEIEQKYTNIDKTCKIKEIKEHEEQNNV